MCLATIAVLLLWCCIIRWLWRRARAEQQRMSRLDIDTMGGLTGPRTDDDE